MSFQTSILLGLIQGLGEFLPISSSGHLAIARHVLGASGISNVPEFFDVLLHFGTLIAVLIAYWDDFCGIVVEFFLGIRDLARQSTPTPVPPARRLLVLLIVGSLPMFGVLPLQDFIESQESNMYFVGGALIVTGILLFTSDRVRRGRKNLGSATLRDAVLVGLGQLLGVCPGISRSGATIAAGCFVGYDRTFAVRFSFMLSIPAVLAANLLTLYQMRDTAVVWSEVPVYLAGMAVAAFVGYLCLRLLKYIAAKGKFGFFAYYCWAVGALTIIMNSIR